MDEIEAIRQMNARFGRAVDERDIETWLSLFTPDGSFQRAGDARVWSGHEQLRALFTTFSVRGRHIFSNFIIDVDADRATQSCYLQFLDRDDGCRLRMFGVYHDQLLKIDGRWRFRSRVLAIDDAGAAAP